MIKGVIVVGQVHEPQANLEIWLDFHTLSRYKVTSQKVRVSSMDSGFRRNDQEVQVHVIQAKAGIQTTRRSTVLPDLLRSYDIKTKKRINRISFHRPIISAAMNEFAASGGEYNPKGIQ